MRTSSEIATDQPANNQQAPAPDRAFITVLTSGVCFVLLAVMARLCWDVFWTDIARHNPYRSQAEAILMIPVMGLLAGAWLTVAKLSGALITAGLLAAAAERRFGRVPFWVITALLPLCALIIYAQDALLPSFRWYTDDPNNEAGAYSPLGRMIVVSAPLLPALVGSWWVLRRRVRAGLRQD